MSLWSAITYIFHHLSLLINSFKGNISRTNLLSDTTSFTVLYMSMAELKTKKKDQKYLHVWDQSNLFEYTLILSIFNQKTHMHKQDAQAVPSHSPSYLI